MTRKLSKHVLLIEQEEPSKCELCGEEKELRPYGPNGENVCFSCAMKNEEAAKQHFAKRLGIIN